MAKLFHSVSSSPKYNTCFSHIRVTETNGFMGAEKIDIFETAQQGRK